jgi:paraquat-inducible protein A
LAERERHEAPILACPDCSLEQRVPAMGLGMVAGCRRCGATLERRAGSSLDAALAFTLTALLLLVPANLAGLMRFRFAAGDTENQLGSGGVALWDQGYNLLGALVDGLVVAVPPLWLAGLAVVLLAVRNGWSAPSLGRLFRAVLELRPWAMVDVYLVGSFVAFTRLQDYGPVEVMPGGWAFVAAALAVLAIDPSLDERRIWAKIGPEEEDQAPRPDDFACLGCERRSGADEEGRPCPRCGRVLARRKPGSFELTAALAAAAWLLYLPSMALPVMTVIRFGRAEPNTILSGVLELFDLGLWPLALIVFTASVAVPILKLGGLTWMLVSIRRPTGRRLVAQTRLYRVIDVIGRWSNIDVFMISILAALVQYQEFASVRAEPGAIAFAGVVILTMLASARFDPRLLWDAAAV